MAGVGGDQAGEQDWKVSCWGRLGLLKVETGQGSTYCSLKNFTIMLMLKEVRQFALFWSREKSQSAVWQPMYLF